MSVILDIDDTVLRRGIYPIKKTIDYVNSLHTTVYMVTGRMETQRRATESALRKAGVRYAALYMNPYSTKDSNKFKAEMAQKLKWCIAGNRQ
jgi:hypothetical protein